MASPSFTAESPEPPFHQVIGRVLRRHFDSLTRIQLARNQGLRTPLGLPARVLTSGQPKHPAENCHPKEDCDV